MVCKDNLQLVDDNNMRKFRLNKDWSEIIEHRRISKRHRRK